MGPRGTGICLAIFVEEDCNSKAKLLLSKKMSRRGCALQQNAKDEHADAHRE
jgi:hypothetical protein